MLNVHLHVYIHVHCAYACSYACSCPCTFMFMLRFLSNPGFFALSEIKSLTLSPYSWMQVSVNLAVHVKFKPLGIWCIICLKSSDFWSSGFFFWGFPSSHWNVPPNHSDFPPNHGFNPTLSSSLPHFGLFSSVSDISSDTLTKLNHGYQCTLFESKVFIKWKFTNKS